MLIAPQDLAQASPEETTSLSVPTPLLFLTGIGLAEAKLSLSWSNDGLRLSELSGTIVSNSSLQLWAGLQLYGLELHFQYANLPGGKDTSITFSATLLIAQAVLNFVISYHGSSSGTIASQPAQDADHTVTTANDEVWTATSIYAGKISILDIMSSISAINMDVELSSIELSALCEVINITLSNLTLNLSYKRNNLAFSFDAHVKYLFFDGPVSLQCSKSTSWIYTFTFGISSERFLSNFGIELITLTDSFIALSNAPATDSSLVDTVSNGLNIIFSGTLVFTDSLKVLEKVTGVPNLWISGSVSNSGFTLAASVSEISLFNNMTLLGGLFFSYTFTSKRLVAAIQGYIFISLSFSCLTISQVVSVISTFQTFPRRHFQPHSRCLSNYQILNSASSLHWID